MAPALVGQAFEGEELMGESSDGAAGSVERALDIVELIAEHAGGMTNSEISRRLGIPKSSASYILRVLERRGYLRRDEASAKYRLGLRVLALGKGVLAGLDAREAALPALRRLVEASGLTSHFAVLDHNEVVYIEKVEAPGFVKVDTWPGRRSGIHATSVGKAIAAHLAHDQVQALVSQGGLQKLTARTVTSLPKLLRELEATRARGFAVDDEENAIGIRCVAAPVFDGRGAVVGAINVTGTTAQIDERTIPGLGELVMAEARTVSQLLGFRSRSAHG
jgi:IclR family KDG regulon transcriptional repressor